MDVRGLIDFDDVVVGPSTFQAETMVSRAAGSGGGSVG